MPMPVPVPVPVPMPSIRPRPPTTRTHAQAPRCAALVAVLRRPQPVRRQRLHGLQWAPGLGHIGPRTRPHRPQDSATSAPGLGHIDPRTRPHRPQDSATSAPGLGHNGQVHPVLIGMLREHLESKGEVLEGERTLPV
jgi:hypothetical protein